MPPKPPTLAAVTANVKPLVKTARICLDGDLVRRMDELNQAWARAKVSDEDANEPDQAPALAKELHELEQVIRQAEVEFVFQALGKTAWRDLISHHPPTKDEKARGADFNLDTFPVAAMAACCISPAEADVEGFEALRERVTDGQWDRLWITCHEANTADGDAPNFAAVYATARRTAPS